MKSRSSTVPPRISRHAGSNAAQQFRSASTIVLFATAIVTVASCSQRTTSSRDIDTRYSATQTLVAHSAFNTVGSSQSKNLEPQIGAAYSTESAPIREIQILPQSPWVTNSGLTVTGETMIRVIADADQYGIDPQRIHQNDIYQLLASPWTLQTARAFDSLLTSSFKLMFRELGSGRVNPSDSQVYYFDKPEILDVDTAFNQLTGKEGSLQQTLSNYQHHWKKQVPLVQAIAEYRQIEKNGGWGQVEPGPKLEVGSQGPRVLALKNRLITTDDYQDLYNSVSASTNLHDIFDSATVDAVKRFQRRHGLLDDGIAGKATIEAFNISAGQRARQMELNLERLRWMPADLGSRHLVTNIPDFQLNIVEEEEIAMTIRVVVGKNKHKTPVFSADMNHIVVNPTWTVPRSITNKELVPKERKNPGYLSRSNFEILSSSGKPVHPTSVSSEAWAKSRFPYTLRQKPGKSNALGKVKFMLPNPYAIYLHDTPSKSLFAKNKRAFSHGCVRVAEPRKLANYLMKLQGLDDSEIQRKFASKRTQTVRLADPIPNHIIYLTSWIDQHGTIHFRNDVYGQDKPLDKALAQESIDRQRLMAQPVASSQTVASR